MRFTDLSNKTILEFIEELDEVRMGASDLSKFPSTPAAQGIRAGFEAELCFSGLGGGGGEDEYPEPDYDEDRRARSIDDVCSFFEGDYNSRADIRELREKMENDFSEWVSDQVVSEWSRVEESTVRDWIEENDYNFEKHIIDYLQDDLGLDQEQIDLALKSADRAQEFTSSKQLSLFAEENEAFAHYAEARDYANNLLDAKVEEAIQDKNRNYDYAYEEWADEQRGEYTERDWLEDAGLSTMSDIESNYSMSWPYYNYGESDTGNEYDTDKARELARDLGNSLEIRVTASGGYHSTKRQEGLWIIEPDSSLEADDGDMPAEFISPPMPLQECLTKMRQFFEWAKDNGAYTNESTGLHVGISLPSSRGDFAGGNIDYVKLALFLGDQYVLDLFDRDGNTYCKSAFDKISRDISAKTTEESMASMLDQMRQGLSQRALNLITSNMSHGKYTSINLKGDYVEFRSMGGANYLDTVDLVISTVQRFAMAMSIAGDPNAYRQEYAKKLYKLLDPSRVGVNTSTIEYFAKYASGQLPRSALSSFVKQIKLQRELLKQKQQSPTDATDGQQEQKYWWNVWVRGNSAFRIEVVARNEQEAKEIALSKVPEWQNNRSIQDLMANVIRTYFDVRV